MLIYVKMLGALLDAVHQVLFWRGWGGCPNPLTARDTPLGLLFVVSPRGIAHEGTGVLPLLGSRAGVPGFCRFTLDW